MYLFQLSLRFNKDPYEARTRANSGDSFEEVSRTPPPSRCSKSKRVPLSRISFVSSGIRGIFFPPRDSKIPRGSSARVRNEARGDCARGRFSSLNQHHRAGVDRYNCRRCDLMVHSSTCRPLRPLANCPFRLRLAFLARPTSFPLTLDKACFAARNAGQPALPHENCECNL